MTSPTLAGAVAALYERGFLTDKTVDEEAAALAGELEQTVGRDPGEKLDRLRRERREGAADYWAAASTRKLTDLAPRRRRVDVALFADCDLQREAEFLAREGETRGLDIRVGATFPDDIRWVEERKPDVILIGALRSRGAIAAAGPGEDPARDYIAEARRLIGALRARSAAPILIDNLPEPTVQPLGMAERGAPRASQSLSPGQSRPGRTRRGIRGRRMSSTSRRRCRAPAPSDGSTTG